MNSAKPGAVLSSTLSDRSVLVVEDEVIVALELGDTLSDFGFGEVRVAHNLRGAEKQLEGWTPDLAILDVNLGSGERTLGLGERLTENGVTVVFATGYNRDEIAEHLNGYAYMEKPLSQRTLEMKLDAIVKAW